MASRPPIKERKSQEHILSHELARKAIETVKNLIAFLEFGPPIIRYGPGGELHIDIPLMYNGYALDRLHYDPYTRTLSPKGRPVRAWNIKISANEVLESIKDYINEFKAVEAVEYRDPEKAWAVPLTWRLYIVAYIKVSHNGEEIVPDYGLTEEVRRHVL